MDILSVVTRFPILMFGVERNDDDFADRINYKYTVAVLVIFAIIVTNRQFGTKQIHCWIPAYFTRNYEEYINDICWVSNTYYISLDQKLPEAEQIRKSFELKYYQWVPFILLSQAFFFYIPHIAWRALSRRSGIDIRDIVEAASNYKSVEKYENRQKYMSYMLTAVDQYVDDPRRRKDSRRIALIKRLVSGLCFVSGKFLGNYLMVLYLFIKLSFIANCICQLFVLNLLLGHEFHKFGFELLDKILNGKGWDTGSRIFPKISMCDFRIREVGNPKVSHRYTVQCVLPINLFNQQIFTFIWFWYNIVLIINIYSLFVWTYRFLPSKRLRYISRRIEIMRQALFYRNSRNPLNFNDQDFEINFMNFEKDLIAHFVHEYLESDGLFILRVLSSNTSDFVCTELIQELWKYYRKQRKFTRSESSEEENNKEEDYEYHGGGDGGENGEATLVSIDKTQIVNTIKRIPKKSSNSTSNKVRFQNDIKEEEVVNNEDTIKADSNTLNRKDSVVVAKKAKKNINYSNSQDGNNNNVAIEEQTEEDDTHHLEESFDNGSIISNNLPKKSKKQKQKTSMEISYNNNNLTGTNSFESNADMKENFSQEQFSEQQFQPHTQQQQQPPTQAQKTPVRRMSTTAKLKYVALSEFQKLASSTKASLSSRSPRASFSLQTDPLVIDPQQPPISRTKLIRSMERRNSKLAMRAMQGLSQDDVNLDEDLTVTSAESTSQIKLEELQEESLDEINTKSNVSKPMTTIKTKKSSTRRQSQQNDQQDHEQLEYVITNRTSISNEDENSNQIKTSEEHRSVINIVNDDDDYNDGDSKTILINNASHDKRRVQDEPELDSMEKSIYGESNEV